MSFVFQDLNIVDNPELTRRWPTRGWFWQPTASRNPRQLVWLTYWLDRKLFGSNAKGWRATGMLLHLMNAVLLAVISPVAAVLFFMHPLTLMGSSYVAGRSGLMSASFQIVIIVLVTNHLLLASLLAVVALLWVKEDSIVFVPMIATLAVMR